MKLRRPVVSLFRPGPLALVVLAYCALLWALMARTPLWLDEVLQLLGTSSGSAWDAVVWASRNAGGVPLGYLLQWMSLQTLGHSQVAARLPSALAAVLCAVLVLRLSRTFGLRSPSLAFLLFLILPLQLRYAVEARPYSLALLWTLAATVVVLKLSAQPSLRLWAFYLVLSIAALYTQPFSLFLLLAHTVWLFGDHRNLAFRLAALQILAVACFLPWYLHSRAEWTSVLSTAGIQAHFEPKTVLMLVREISGGGYALSIPLILLAIWGVRSPALPRQTKLLLGTTILVPLLCVYAADAAFGYFFAIRQLIFILPSLVLLAAEGLRLLYAAQPRLGAAAAVAILLLSAGHTYQHVRTKGENWALAASILSLATDHDACALIAPAAHLSLYAHFQPELLRRTCSPDLAREHVIVAAISPYSTPADQAILQNRLSTARFSAAYSTRAGGSTIQVLRRNPDETLSRWSSLPGPLTANSGPLTANRRTTMTSSSILTTDDVLATQPQILVPDPLLHVPSPAPFCPVHGQRGYDHRHHPGSFE
ncbi:glycosyltransferase family 39 protein [uncultured Paludibaculum sp.]|uniref:glycosyltransferase family 39 protein n=1 Tax=uncultured Paludibaculum sp. TaxID=1765020 RepID=UPI002AABEDC8|nr:glycosyltransferase family 39 protein [uncultured Paludibaculum sp.]